MDDHTLHDTQVDVDKDPQNGSPTMINIDPQLFQSSDNDSQELLGAFIKKIQQVDSGKQLLCNSLQLIGHLVDYSVWLEVTKTLEEAGAIESKLIPNGYGGRDIEYFVVNNSISLKVEAQD